VGADLAQPTETAYIPISAATLIPETSISTSLYIARKEDGQMQLYRGADVPFEEADLNSLIARGHSKVYVQAGEHAQYQQYLRDNLSSVLDDESLSVQRRFTSLNDVIRDVLAKSFSAGNVAETVDTCRDLAENTVDLILRNDVMASDLLGVMHHDYHTFTHSANVSYYCVMLAENLQLTDEEGLKQIATGGLLHDLGKLDIPDKILSKPGRLTDAEFEVIRAHPRTGFRKLCQRDDLSFAQLMMVYQHHERLDGKGYPVGVTAEEIHPWAQMCTVVDVFEALTSNRPYRTGMPYDKAFEIIDRDIGKAFDRDIVQCWKKTIQPK